MSFLKTIFRNFSFLRSKHSVDTDKNDFSAFIRDASVEEKKRVLKEAVRKANEDQRKIVEQYHQMQAKSTR